MDDPLWYLPIIDDAEYQKALDALSKAMIAWAECERSEIVVEEEDRT